MTCCLWRSVRATPGWALWLEAQATDESWEPTWWPLLTPKERLASSNIWKICMSICKYHAMRFRWSMLKPLVLWCKGGWSELLDFCQEKSTSCSRKCWRFMCFLGKNRKNILSLQTKRNTNDVPRRNHSALQRLRSIGIWGTTREPYSVWPAWNGWMGGEGRSRRQKKAAGLWRSGSKSKVRP